MSKTKLICNCNKSMPLDAKALAAAQLARPTGEFEKPKFLFTTKRSARTAVPKSPAAHYELPLWDIRAS